MQYRYKDILQTFIKKYIKFIFENQIIQKVWEL